MEKLMNHWYWCRASIGPYTIISCDIIADKKYNYTRLPVLMIGKDGVILDDDEQKTSIERINTIYHPVTKKFIDNTLIFTQKTDEKTSYRIAYNREKDMFADSLLYYSGITPFKRILAKMIGMNPTYLQCFGKVNLTVIESGYEKVFEQEGLWEQMFLGNNKDAIINAG
jgi:hypothetical protein